jgi:hypothetical protein
MLNIDRVKQAVGAAWVRLDVEITSPGVRRVGFKANLLGSKFRFKTLPERLMNRMRGRRIGVWHWTCNSPLNEKVTFSLGFGKRASGICGNPIRRTAKNNLRPV